MSRLSAAVWAVVGLLAVLPGARALTPSPTPPSVSHTTGCLLAGNGYLRARIRGAMNLDIDWHNNEMECNGEPRPNGHGVRISFAGPRHSDGRRLRMVFGVAGTKEGASGRETPCCVRDGWRCGAGR